MEHPTPDSTYARIHATVDSIPEGSVATYGQVAKEAGLPRRARLVGRALSTLPRGSRLPWHRVITSSGKSAFEPNSRNFRRQRDRLAEEGVPLINGKVDMKKYRWEPDLDELLWKPSSTWDEE